jgi:transcriptional regulator GlxA family with amidase domain
LTELLIQVVHYVTDNLHRDSTALALSKRLALKESALLKGFQLHTGIALDKYVLRRRLERALDLLKNSNDTDSEIAVQIGWEATPVFRLAFSSYLGFSPTEYRRALKRKTKLRVRVNNDVVNSSRVRRQLPQIKVRNKAPSD